MAVKSDVFGGTVLTGDDAVRFEQQVEKAEVSAEARRTAETGRELVRRFNTHGGLVHLED